MTAQNVRNVLLPPPLLPRFVNERGVLTDLREFYENRQIFQEFQTIFALVKRFSQKSVPCTAVKILQMENGKKVMEQATKTQTRSKCIALLFL
jgi:hypothetical protein